MEGKKRGVLIAAVLLALVLVMGTVAYRSLSANSTPPEAESTTSTTSNKPMLADYDATVYTELGEPIALSAIADGKPLVVNFWATWCPYCIQEMDDYQQLYHIYGDRISFAFVDCNYSRGETVEKASAWLQDNGYGDLPAYYDTDAEATHGFGVWSYPTSIVVDANGEIVSAASGAIDLGQMDALLVSLVS